MSQYTSTLHELTELLQHSPELNPKETWIVFDIDHVVTQPSEPCFQLATIKRFWFHPVRSLLGLSPELKDLVYTLLVNESHSELVQPGTASLIRSLQTSGFTVIGLTSALTGPVGRVPEMCQWRYEELKRLDIDLKLTAPPIDNHVMRHLPAFHHQHPAWHNGVLFTNGQNSKVNKARLLRDFCTKHKLSFASLVFIDDSSSNIRALKQGFKSWLPEVKVFLLHFKGHTFPREPVDAVRMKNLWDGLVVKAKSQAAPSQTDGKLQVQSLSDHGSSRQGPSSILSNHTTGTAKSMKLLLRDILNYYRVAWRFRSSFWQGMQTMMDTKVKSQFMMFIITLFMPLMLIITAFQKTARQYGRTAAWRRWVVVLTYWPLEFYLRRVKYGLEGAYAKGPFVPKLHWQTFFAKIKLRTPPVLAVSIDGEVQGELPRERLFIKPDEGALGQETHQYSWSDERELFQSATDSKTFTELQFREWLAQLSKEKEQKTYVVQRVVKICRELSHLPSHTLRLVTFKKYDGSIVLVNPCFHLSNGHITSHAANGGAYFELDIAGSRIGKRFLGTEMKIDVEGTSVPSIKAAVEQALYAHEHLPDGILWAGWDVMLTDEGPCFLEGNIPPGDIYHFLFYPELKKTWNEICWPELLKYLDGPKRKKSVQVPIEAELRPLYS
ncbi:MAG: DUF2608 domain-containing protein [Oligoflexus sp.]|nr:DUF2608 domain-containing protein [Oligoflexus sp.]